MNEEPHIELGDRKNEEDFDLDRLIFIRVNKLLRVKKESYLMKAK